MSETLILQDWQGANYPRLAYSIGLRPERLELNFMDGRTIAIELENNDIRVHTFAPNEDEPFSLRMLAPKPTLIIQVFPMNGDTLADRHVDVTGYDILYRPDGGDPILEFEGMTLLQAEQMASLLADIYPEAEEDWSCVELLR